MNVQNDLRLLIGGVYKVNFDKKPVRVIAFDEHLIFYDIWWDSINDWAYKNSLSDKVIFYRKSLIQFINSAVFLRVEPLTEKEKNIYRPDLPLAIFRNRKISWSRSHFASIKEYETELLKQSIEITKLPDFNIAEVYLVPFGPKGGDKKSILIKAANGIYFTGMELLWQAQNIQAPHLKENIEKGIGIHRQGFQKQLPSYYIAGYYDLAGILNDD